MVRAYDDNGNVVDLVNWEKEIRADEREKTLREIETRLLSNCSMMYKDNKKVIVLRGDIFKFIIERMKKGVNENEKIL